MQLLDPSIYTYRSERQGECRHEYARSLEVASRDKLATLGGRSTFSSACVAVRCCCRSCCFRGAPLWRFTSLCSSPCPFPSSLRTWCVFWKTCGGSWVVLFVLPPAVRPAAREVVRCSAVQTGGGRCVRHCHLALVIFVVSAFLLSCCFCLFARTYVCFCR